MPRNDESTAPVAKPSATEDAATAPAVPAPPFVPGKVTIDRTVRLPSITFCMARHQTSGRVFCGGADFGLHHFDPAAEKPEPKALSELRHSSYVTGLVSTGSLLISGGYDKSLIWWNAETGEQIRRNEGAHERWIRALAISPDGTKLASVGDDMKTKIWDVGTGNCLLDLDGYELQTPHGFPSMLYAVAFSADGSRIATGNKTGKVFIRDVHTGQIQQTIETPVMYTWDPKRVDIPSAAFDPSLFLRMVRCWQSAAWARSATSITSKASHVWRCSAPIPVSGCRRLKTANTRDSSRNCNSAMIESG